MGLLDDADAYARSRQKESDRQRRSEHQTKKASRNAMDRGAREYSEAAIARDLPMTKIYGWGRIRRGWLVHFPARAADEDYPIGSIVIGPEGDWLWCTSQLARPMFGRSFIKWTTSDASKNKPQRQEMDLSPSRIYDVFKNDLADKINTRGKRK